MDLVLINGLINAFLSVKVLITSLMVWVDMFGLMEGLMKVSTQTILNMALVFTRGLMVKSIEVVGKTVNSMDSVLTFILMNSRNR